MSSFQVLAKHAIDRPDKPAVINAHSGAILSYRELEFRSRRLANLLHARGLRRGDHIAIMMENSTAYIEAVWAGLRSGLYVTPINRYFTAGEAAYVINDCGARAVILSNELRDVARALVDEIGACSLRLIRGPELDGWTSYDEAIEQASDDPREKEWLGETMLYSSGTTGRPKGIKRELTGRDVNDGWFRPRERMRHYGFSQQCVYLSTAPLYHAAPLNYLIGTQFFGGTAVMMERFDAETALRCIETHRVTHSQWVPTMFIRLLKLPAPVRSSFDLSSLEVAIHAAAPCPIEVKRQMIEWFGQRIFEYYGATEGIGTTFIDTAEWLRKPGSVGKPLSGLPHICNDTGEEVASGQEGLIYFEQDTVPFVYFNDPEKTESARHPCHRNWYTVGDIGYLDEDGYLYLTDRKAFMIVSGGVNIYPQAVENALALHPSVRDVAVIGVPNAEFGEEVKAVIELEDGVAASEELKADFIQFAAARVARFMLPKSIDFTDRIPRLPTGKLYKQKLREAYWNAGR